MPSASNPLRCYDSHAHIEMCGEPSEVVDQARQAGISKIISVGCDLPSSRLAQQFSERFEQVYACVGIHPHEASGVDDATIAELRGLAVSARTVAIGETGLDFYRDRSPRPDQEAAFIKHIELARDAGLPLMVHTRDAGDRTMEILEKHASGLAVILHCFSLYDRVEECAERGYYMSVAGNVTFTNAKDLRESVTRIPSNLLLTETDAPFLTPVPFRGKKNNPGHVRYVPEELATLRGEDLTAIASGIEENFHRAFSL